MIHKKLTSEDLLTEDFKRTHFVENDVVKFLETPSDAFDNLGKAVYTPNSGEMDTILSIDKDGRVELSHSGKFDCYFIKLYEPFIEVYPEVPADETVVNNAATNLSKAAVKKATAKSSSTDTVTTA